jgi:hypothetical protein
VYADAPGFEETDSPFSARFRGHDPNVRTYAVDPQTPIVIDLAVDEADVTVRAVARPDVLVRTDGGDEATGDAVAPPGLRVGGEGNRLTIATRRAAVDSEDGDFHPFGHQRGGRRGLAGWLSFIGLAGGCDGVDSVEVETPLGATLNLHLLTGSGDVRLDGLGGEIDVRAGSGDVSATRCQGHLRIDIGSGDVSLTECAAALRVQTGSGDLDVRDASAPSAELRSGSGDIGLRRVALGSGPFEIHTGAGDVHLEVFREDGSGAPIGLRYVALVGDASIGEGFMRVRGRSAAEASPLVSVHTAAGDLTARRVAARTPANSWGAVAEPTSVRVPVRAAASDHPPAAGELDQAQADPGRTHPLPMPTPPAAPAPPEPPAFERTVGAAASGPVPAPTPAGDDAPRDQDERILLLQQVAAGEIGIEEALRRLG